MGLVVRLARQENRDPRQWYVHPPLLTNQHQDSIVLTPPRLHLRPNRPRNRKSRQKHHNLPTHPELGHPPRRRPRDPPLAQHLQIPPPDPLAPPRPNDGLPRKLL